MIRKGHPLSELGRLKFTMKNRKHTAQSRDKMRQAHQGHSVSVETREKIRIKLRLANAKRRKNLGISNKVDEGATEYFNSLNSQNGFHIQHPNIFFNELGYFADGYDPVLHAWFEYDTPSHLRKAKLDSDHARQEKIVKHFQQIGKPLTAFFRINQTGVGKPGMRNVLLTA